MAFVKKNIESEKFGRWFQKREGRGAASRRGAKNRPYKEENARTDRRFNSPIFYFRRLANEIFAES